MTSKNVLFVEGSIYSSLTSYINATATIDMSMNNTLINDISDNFNNDGTYNSLNVGFIFVNSNGEFPFFRDTTDTEFFPVAFQNLITLMRTNFDTIAGQKLQINIHIICGDLNSHGITPQEIENQIDGAITSNSSNDNIKVIYNFSEAGATSEFDLSYFQDNTTTNKQTGSVDIRNTYFINDSGSNDIDRWPYRLNSANSFLRTNTSDNIVYQGDAFINNVSGNNIKYIRIITNNDYPHIKQLNVNVNISSITTGSPDLKYTIQPIGSKYLSQSNVSLEGMYQENSNKFQPMNVSEKTISSLSNGISTQNFQFEEFIHYSQIFVLSYYFVGDLSGVITDMSGGGGITQLYDLSQNYLIDQVYELNQYEMYIELNIKNLNFTSTQHNSMSIIPSNYNYLKTPIAGIVLLNSTLSDRNIYENNLIYSSYFQLKNVISKTYIIKNFYAFGSRGYSSDQQFLQNYESDYKLLNWENTGQQNMELNNSILEYSIFEKFSLFSAKISATSFDNSRMKTCMFNDCDFSGVSFENVSWENVKILNSSNVFENCVTGPIIYNIDLINPINHGINKVVCETSIITGVDSDFNYSSTTYDCVVHSKHSNYRYLITPNVLLDRKDIRETEFKNKSLKGSSLKFSLLSRSYFKNVSFRDVDFEGADLEGCYFDEGCDFNNVDLRNTKLDNCFFHDDLSGVIGPLQGNFADYGTPEIMTTNGIYAYVKIDNTAIDISAAIINEDQINLATSTNYKHIEPNTTVFASILTGAAGNVSSFFPNSGMYLIRVEDHVHTHGSTHGDPHIFPIYGTPYELPSSLQTYRMLQGNSLVVNASTRKIKEEEGLDILNFFERVSGKLPPDDIVIDGYFYEKVFVESEDNVFIYDFLEETIEYDTNNSYFNVRENTNIRNKKLEPITKEFVLSFRHSQYGLISMSFKYYINPQSKYGFDLDMKGTQQPQNLSGLLVREYLCSSMTVKSLYSTENKVGKVGQNQILSSRKRIPQVRR